ncbi:MAG: hypothetical protein C5B60_06850 [Chloroflexi bacterium]|nr:MAG: hypothetical protein C5B60_06850 [Chloroflexota bacterium]
MNKPRREGFVGTAVDEKQADVEMIPPEMPEPPEPPEPPPQEPSKPLVATAPVPTAPPPSQQELPKPGVWPIVMKLRRPVHEGGKHTPEIKELSFREPRARDIIDCGGNPMRYEVVSLSGNTIYYNWVVDDTKMMRLMANLADVLEPAIHQMDTNDYANGVALLRHFFIAESRMVLL